MKKVFCIAGTVIGLFSLLSCSTTTHQFTLPRSTQATVDKAQKQGFRLVRYKATPFVLTTYEKLDDKLNGTLSYEARRSESETSEERRSRMDLVNKEIRGTVPLKNKTSIKGTVPVNDSIVHVYIEGDGNSWTTKYQLSKNPTPYKPLALRLALADPHPNVIYLARPCQYTPHVVNPRCTEKYWSSDRYAPEVVHAVHDALTQIKSKTQVKEFVLIGFSGGASIATMVASERSDVNGLITVAGDLDHIRLNNHHKVTPLHGSRNAFEVAHKIKHLPQAHWSGGKDKMVPAWLAQSFVKEVNNPQCAKAHTLKGATHHKKWEEEWVGILKKFERERC